MIKSYSFILTPPDNSAKPTVDNTRDKADILKKKIKDAEVEDDVTHIAVLRHASMMIALCTERGFAFMMAQEEIRTVFENTCFGRRAKTPAPNL